METLVLRIYFNWTLYLKLLYGIGNMYRRLYAMNLVLNTTLRATLNITYTNCVYCAAYWYDSIDVIRLVEPIISYLEHGSFYPLNTLLVSALKWA